jgi:cytochrome bd-type quinol oxidase subunit 1
MRMVAAGALISAVGITVAACGSEGPIGSAQEARDLKNVAVTDPDKVRMVANVNLHPTVVAFCVEGAGFASTSREAAGALIRVEAWDAPSGWCGE